MTADTFGVGVRVTDDELEFLVRVPTDIDAGWTDPEAFQSLVADTVWDHLDQQTVLERIATACEPGESVGLGTVTLAPDGTVVDRDLTEPFTE